MTYALLDEECKFAYVKLKNKMSLQRNEWKLIIQLHETFKHKKTLLPFSVPLALLALVGVIICECLPLEFSLNGTGIQWIQRIW